MMVGAFGLAMVIVRLLRWFHPLGNDQVVVFPAQDQWSIAREGIPLQDEKLTDISRPSGSKIEFGSIDVGKEFARTFAVSSPGFPNSRVCQDFLPFSGRYGLRAHVFHINHIGNYSRPVKASEFSPVLAFQIVLSCRKRASWEFISQQLAEPQATQNLPPFRSGEVVAL